MTKLGFNAVDRILLALIIALGAVVIMLVAASGQELVRVPPSVVTNLLARTNVASGVAATARNLALAFGKASRIKNNRDITRSTFPSTTFAGRPKAIAATAAAV